jgi:hypothetical protein
MVEVRRRHIASIYRPRLRLTHVVGSNNTQVLLPRGAEIGAPRGLATAPPPATNDDDDDDDDLLNTPLACERLTITSPSPWRSTQMLSRSRLWLECATAKKHSRVGGRFSVEAHRSSDGSTRTIRFLSCHPPRPDV